MGPPFGRPDAELRVTGDHAQVGRAPDCAEFIIGPANGRTHWLYPGYAIILVLILTALSVPALAASALPKGFVYLRDVDPTIVQDIRYAGAHNFVGRPIKGYAASECILSAPAARALEKVQTVLAARQLALIVWDCYRPTRAVADFWRWSQDKGHTEMKAEFYPHVDKANLFALGYLAPQSHHSRGGTVDVGLVPLGFSAPPAAAQPLKACTAPKGERFEDGTIDLGSGYDCLDPLASTSNPNAGKAALQNRQMLRSAMRAAGFRSYYREWWHFELVSEPFQHGFDFEISASPSPAERLR
jgi:D-alanyl-D-alanine dipeptidase